ncbi:hypothetical protein C8J57DRAFT_1566199, partial [Mycena rebaudengoi]
APTTGGAQAGGGSPPSPDDALLSPTSGGAGAGIGRWCCRRVVPKKVADDGEGGAGGKEGKEGAVVKANKGMILRRSVEYIRYLQQLVTAQGARNRELEEQLKGFRGSSGSASPPSMHLGDGGPNDFAGWAHVGMLGLPSMPEGEDEHDGMEVDDGACMRSMGCTGAGRDGEADGGEGGEGDGARERGLRRKRGRWGGGA